MSMLEMEGRKKVYCKLTFFPLLREEKVNYVFPTSNFQIYSHSFPSILAVFLGLRVGHFCSDFRSFYCTVSSTVKIIREHAVTWHSELPAWFYLLSLGFCVFFKYIFNSLLSWNATYCDHASWVHLFTPVAFCKCDCTLLTSRSLRLEILRC